MTQVKKCETRFRRKEVFRSLVESRVGWNYCIKHFFKSRQSFDWSLSVQTVNWNRITTSCRKWIWVEVTPQTQNLLALRNRTEPTVCSHPYKGPPRSSDLLWTFRVFEEQGSDLSVLYPLTSTEKHVKGNAKRVQKPSEWKQSNDTFFSFSFSSHGAP